MTVRKEKEKLFPSKQTISRIRRFFNEQVFYGRLRREGAKLWRKALCCCAMKTACCRWRQVPGGGFGRSQFNYYKSGTGSGGLVNTAYVTGILDALEADEDLEVDQGVKSIYEEWLKSTPLTREAAGLRTLASGGDAPGSLDAASGKGEHGHGYRRHRQDRRGGSG